MSGLGHVFRCLRVGVLLAVLVACAENSGAQEGRSASWRVSARPIGVIGATETDSASLLYRVADAFLRGDRIIVANAGTHEVKVFSVEGRLIRLFGREGAGPGEFSSMVATVPFAPDSIAVLDQGHRRITVFDRRGEPARTISLGLDAPFYPADLHRYSDGTLLLTTFAGSRPSDQPGVIRKSGPYLHVSADGEVLDTIGVFPGESWVFLKQPSGGSVLAYLPFGPATHAATLGLQTFVGTGEEYRIAILDAGGRRLSSIRGPMPPRPVTRADRRWYEEQRLADSRPADRAALARLFEQMPYPERMPAYDRMLADHARGFLWVRRYPAPGSENAVWDVFRRDGTRITSVRLDAALRVLDVTETRILGLKRDDLGRERLEVYSLLAAGG